MNNNNTKSLEEGFKPETLEEVFQLLISMECEVVWPEELVRSLSKDQLQYLVWRFTAETHSYPDLEFPEDIPEFSTPL